MLETYLKTFTQAFRTRDGAQGPCPHCGGRDRCTVHWRGDRWRYVCRQCHRSGDYADFLQAIGFSKANAFARAEVFKSKNCVPPPSRPDSRRSDFATWQARAAVFANLCSDRLSSKKCLALLEQRGISLATAKAAGLGWSVGGFENRSDWGLPPTGSGARVFRVPEGLFMPVRRLSGIVSAVVKCWPNPHKFPNGRELRFLEIPGGRSSSAFILGHKGVPVVIVESTLDAVLVWQVGAGRVAAVALNGCAKTPEEDVLEFVRSAPAVLASPDVDESGIAYWKKWQTWFPGCLLCPAIGGKDLSDADQAARSGDSGAATVAEWLDDALQSLPPELFPSSHREGC